MASSSVIGTQWGSAMTLSDFMSADVTCQPNQFNLLGSYVVKAGETVTIGMGNLAGQQDAIGRIFVDLEDGTPNAVDGIFQITYYDQNDHPMKIVKEYNTQTLRTNSTDRTKQIPLPIDSNGVSRDKKINLYFKPTGAAAKTVSATNSKLLMDVTRGAGQ